MNSIYLYIHRVIIRHTNNAQKEISRKEALYYISRFHFPKYFARRILEEMIKLKLLERISRDQLRIINQDKSEKVEKNWFK